MAVQTPECQKRSQNHIYSSSFWHKTVASPSIYMKVDTVARASTCDSCFRWAIADTKRIDKYCLLLAEKTPYGTQTQLLAATKKRTSLSVVCVQPKCLWVRAIVWQVDRSKDSRTTAYQRSSAKKKVTKISPIVNIILYSRPWHCDDGILCASVEFVEFLFQSLNLATTIVCMAKHFWPDHPLLYPALTIVIRESNVYVMHIYSTHACLKLFCYSRSTCS